MHETTRRAVLAASGAALATAVAGCTTSTGDSATGGAAGDDGASGDAESGTTGGEESGSGLPGRVEVTMMSIPQVKFEPEMVHIGVGGTVSWKLESGSHDTTAYHPETKPPCRMPEDADPWQSPTLSSVGETFEHTFEQPGVYDYLDTEAVCTKHSSIGAMGRVVVGWPDPEGQPALAPPQAELPDLIQSKIEDFNPRTRELLADGPDAE